MRLPKSAYGAILVAVLCALPSSSSAQEARKAVSKPSPVYPEIAKRMRLTGTVKIEIVIGMDGEIKHTNVIGGHPLLVDTALEALKKWKYEPSKTETTVTVQFDFRP